jgi:AraC-like DNA-binding protein
MLADPPLPHDAHVEARHVVSARTLQRLFARYVGVGPKWVLARYRIHDAVTELDAGYTGPLADLAASLGWYDQAHFVRDFARLVGEPPDSYRRRTRR